MNDLQSKRNDATASDFENYQLTTERKKMKTYKNKPGFVGVGSILFSSCVGRLLLVIAEEKIKTTTNRHKVKYFAPIDREKLS
jgi:hypothetical protein